VPALAAIVAQVCQQRPLKSSGKTSLPDSLFQTSGGILEEQIKKVLRQQDFAGSGDGATLAGGYAYGSNQVSPDQGRRFFVFQIAQPTPSTTKVRAEGTGVYLAKEPEYGQVGVYQTLLLSLRGPGE
jgi:hypothetical protein